MLALKILPRSTKSLLRQVLTVLVSISFPWFTPLTAIRCSEHPLQLRPSRALRALRGNGGDQGEIIIGCGATPLSIVLL
jgi:hypothetical protein